MIDIDNVLAKAQKMMLDENWNAQVEMGAAAHRVGSLNNKGASNDLSLFEEQAFGGVSNNTNYTPIPKNISINKGAMIQENGSPIQILSENNKPINSKLPKKILESFSNQPPLTGGDDFSIPPQSYYPSNSQQAKPKITEQYIPQNNGIDYNALKFIINECIKENLKTLNENSSLNDFRGMRIGNGSVIQFVDTKGNLYEGKLVLKKKANK